MHGRKLMQMDPPTSMIGERSFSIKRINKTEVQLCYAIEQGKNRTVEQLADSVKTETKTVTETFHVKDS